MEGTSLIVALLCILGKVSVAMAAERFCGSDSREHPEGFCGNRLLEMRQNLCTLLAIDFPEKFTFPPRNLSKRSTRPFEDLPQTDLLGKVPGDDRWDQNAANTVDEVVRRMFGITRAGQTSRPSQKRAGPMPLEEMLPMQKRGIICDCCYNKCLPSILARYC